MGDCSRSPGEEMSQDSDDVSTSNQTEEYDEPTVESDPEEESRGIYLIT